LLVLAQQLSEVEQSFFYFFRQVPHGLRLGWRNAAVDPLGRLQDVVAEVVAPHALWICDGVNLAEDLNKFRTFVSVLDRIDDDAPPRLLSLLNLSQLFVGLNRLGYE